MFQIFFLIQKDSSPSYKSIVHHKKFVKRYIYQNVFVQKNSFLGFKGPKNFNPKYFSALPFGLRRGLTSWGRGGGLVPIPDNGLNMFSTYLRIPNILISDNYGLVNIGKVIIQCIPPQLHTHLSDVGPHLCED